MKEQLNILEAGTKLEPSSSSSIGALQVCVGVKICFSLSQKRGRLNIGISLQYLLQFLDDDLFLTVIFEESMESGEGTFTRLIAFGKSCCQTLGSQENVCLHTRSTQNHEIVLYFFENKERKLYTKITVL